MFSSNDRNDDTGLKVRSFIALEVYKHVIANDLRKLRSFMIYRVRILMTLKTLKYDVFMTFQTPEIWP